ncbi:MAG: hypothetical protein HQM02_14060, partial [Magnetococcales bacterium]|nr:hypothetical protein [Magnetococcales bacterium]
GVVSRFFHNHSVWNAISKGWFEGFDPRRIQLIGYCTEPKAGETLGEWARSLLAARLDILIYPELGMDTLTAQLAALRLAPVQMVAWGHPETSGLPTMDYYLSAELFEAGEAARYYSERLVTLPNLGVCCARMTLEGDHRVDPAPFGLDPRRPILINPGTPCKYTPRHDGLFLELARRIDGCQLVFFDLPKYLPLCQARNARLRRLFHAAGIPFEGRVFLLPWLAGETYHGLLRVATLMLDTIGFSGFNTVLQAVECGLPVVTLEGRFLRGRLGAGILRRLGLADIVTLDETDYVALAIRLATDAPFREAIRSRMAAALPELFMDMRPIHALQDFLEEVGKTGASTR